MQVFKFGGASVKDAAGIINLADIVRQHQQVPLLIVASAMGKTTNALEKLCKAYVDGDDNVHALFAEVKAFHYEILEALFEPGHKVFDEVENTFVEIDWMIEDEPHDDYDFIYDQIVSVGELVSTRIINAYLNLQHLPCHWLDVRGYIHTDNTYREAIVNFDKTAHSIQHDIPALLTKSMVITQGFLGGTSENFTTTLGREGSDYTAAIFAACLNAESVTIWKDVPGVLNADPKLFADTVKFDELPYQEAIEMSYYGAGIIHPKTLKPLQNALIPLYVKPFLHPTESGTKIHKANFVTYTAPVIIVKANQVLLSISAKDYSFINEHNLSHIYNLFAQNHIQINLMQNSALSFTTCFNYDERRFDKLIEHLQPLFSLKYNTGLTLITVRHYKPETLGQLSQGKTVFLEQTSRNTAQMVVR